MSHPSMTDWKRSHRHVAQVRRTLKAAGIPTRKVNAGRSGVTVGERCYWSHDHGRAVIVADVEWWDAELHQATTIPRDVLDALAAQFTCRVRGTFIPVLNVYPKDPDQ